MRKIDNLAVAIRHGCTIVAILLLSACGGGGTDSGAAVGAVSPISPAFSLALTNIVAIGDSIGNGFGLATPWPDRLAGALGVPVQNNSVTNEQTSFGLSIIADRIATQSPSHVVILLGTNDAIRGSVSNAIANLQEMVNIANANNVIAIVGTLPPITRSAAENLRAQEISVGIRGLVGARIAEIEGAFVGQEDLIVDGVHPGDPGQDIITNEFLSLIP